MSNDAIQYHRTRLATVMQDAVDAGFRVDDLPQLTDEAMQQVVENQLE